jgi:thioesterase domain-containing protein
VFGNVVGYADLCRELGPEQPFFGLDAVGLDGAERPLESIEEMAERYVSEIRPARPHGPYALIGTCFGATVAYEMVRQLTEAGEEVVFLGLLDPLRLEGKSARQSPVSGPRASSRARALGSLLADRLQLYREEMRGLAAGNRIKDLARKLRSLGGSIGNDNRFKGVARELHQIEVYRANELALRRYQYRRLNGGLRVFEIFESTNPRNVRLSDRLDWGALWEGQMKQHHVPGKNSGEMVTGENARVLGTLLALRLRAAFSQESGKVAVFNPNNAQGLISANR